MSTSDKSQNDKSEAETIAEGLGMLSQLLDDIEDEGFWTDPDWEEKNNRDSNGMPVE